MQKNIAVPSTLLDRPQPARKPWIYLIKTRGKLLKKTRKPQTKTDQKSNTSIPATSYSTTTPTTNKIIAVSQYMYNNS